LYGRTRAKGAKTGPVARSAVSGVSKLNQKSEFPRKVSAYLLDNSRFAESESGDWFDFQLRDRGASDKLLAARLGTSSIPAK